MNRFGVRRSDTGCATIDKSRNCDHFSARIDTLWRADLLYEGKTPWWLDSHLEVFPWLAPDKSSPSTSRLWLIDSSVIDLPSVTPAESIAISYAHEVHDYCPEAPYNWVPSIPWKVWKLNCRDGHREIITQYDIRQPSCWDLFFKHVSTDAAVRDQKDESE